MDKSARVLISLPDQFLDEIDVVAKEEHRTRSELIREALRKYILSMENMDTMVQTGLLE